MSVRDDELIGGAVEAASSNKIYGPKSHLEKDLVTSVVSQLIANEAVGGVVREAKYELSAWTRPPGGVDLAVDWRDGSGRAICEMKVGKPDESLWDAIKLADIQCLDPSVRGGYLISDARWHDGDDGAALFSATGPSEMTCREMIERWPHAWKNLLIGGRGIRPRRSVGAVRLTRLLRVDAAHHPGRTLAVVRVEPLTNAEPQSYDSDGWPEGYEPPDALRQSARDAAELPARTPKVDPALEQDECHEYPWYSQWTQGRLDALVPTLTDEAYACLRRRLHAERSWTEGELSAWVDPLRRSGIIAPHRRHRGRQPRIRRAGD